ncbi:hypothetical protein ACO2Q0_10750 [Phenylobacterium sp. VNQ135]|uniref:hypothetical protein n=1 Tax=Phenylobacterium sp. VNQ135 TaxID=3400922 RepID=UPI003C11CA56
MARRPEDDPRITDLRRYKKAREQARRRPPPKPKRPAEGFLGSNPRAGLILAAVAAIVAALYVVPMFL